MFDKLREIMKGLINIFKPNDIKKALEIDVSITQTMLDKIDQWSNMLNGNADWCNDEYIYSLRLEQSIVREFSNISLNEMTINISNKKLETIVTDSICDINEHFQKGLALGAMIIKPLGENKVQYVSQNGFIPVEYDVRGRLIKVIFPEIKKVNNSYYTRLEYHCLTDKGLTITNKAYHSTNKNQLGYEVPLESIVEWANLETSVLYPLMTRPVFGYYRNPIANSIDNSFCGVSIYDCAENLIKKTDIQFSRLDWEFESGERAIHIDDTALHLDKAKPTVSKLNKRLYRGLNLSGKNGEELFKDFSPEFRDGSIINGLEEYKRNIEFAVGLSYGDISNPQTIEKTATEILSAKKRKYNTVTAIQKNLCECIDDLVYAFAFYNGLATSGYEFTCDFKDSILNDEQSERKQDLQDMSIGIMRPEEYRAKWYGETEKQALKNLPQNERVLE